MIKLVPKCRLVKRNKYYIWKETLFCSLSTTDDTMVLLLDLLAGVLDNHMDTLMANIFCYVAGC